MKMKRESGKGDSFSEMRLSEGIIIWATIIMAALLELHITNGLMEIGIRGNGLMIKSTALELNCIYRPVTSIGENGIITCRKDLGSNSLLMGTNMKASGSKIWKMGLASYLRLMGISLEACGLKAIELLLFEILHLYNQSLIT